MPRPVPFGRALLAAGLVTLALTACGRRGPLEPPPDPVAVAAAEKRAQQDRERQARRLAGAAQGVEGQPGGPNSPQLSLDDDDETALGPSITPTPRSSGSRRRGYVVPKEPFVLDPLL